MKNYYSILEIPSETPTSEMDAALRESRRRLRQLTGSADEEKRSRAEHAMQAVQEAWPILTDPGKRSAYDAELKRSSVPLRFPAAVDEGDLSADERLDNLLRLGKEHIRWGRGEKALQLAKSACEEFPDSREMAHFLWRAAGASGNGEEIAAAAERVWQLNPRDDSAFARWALTQAAWGDGERALAASEQRMSEHPERSLMRTLHTEVLWWSNRQDEALVKARSFASAEGSEFEDRRHYADLLWRDVESRVDRYPSAEGQEAVSPQFLGPQQVAFVAGRFEEIRRTGAANSALLNVMAYWEECMEVQSRPRIGSPGRRSCLGLIAWICLLMFAMPPILGFFFGPRGSDDWAYDPVFAVGLVVGCAVLLTRMAGPGWTFSRRKLGRPDTPDRNPFVRPSPEKLLPPE